MVSVVIIGGGVSGLTAATALSRQGATVQLFEAGENTGGCCATTNMAGYVFNDGALFLAMPSLIDHLFSRLGLDRQTLLPLRKIAASHSLHLPDGTMTVLGDGRNFRIGRDGKFRSDTALSHDLEGLVDKWGSLLDLFAEEILTRPFSLWTLLRKGWWHLPKMRGSAADELSRMVSDENLRATLSATLLFTGLAPEEMPVMTMLGAVSMLRDGFFIPQGGMGKVTDVLAEAARNNGTIIHTNTAARRILVDGNRAQGVELENGETVKVDVVLSTLSGMLTYGKLLAPSVVPPALGKKADQAPLSHRSISLQLGLKNKIGNDAAPVSHNNSVLPLMNAQGDALKEQQAPVHCMNFSVPTVTLPELAPEGGSVVEMFLSVSQEQVAEDWTDTLRDEIAGRSLERLADLYPLEIETQRVRSPRDFRDQMGLYEGALYGLSPGAPPSAQFPCKAPIEGLFHAGQTTWPGMGVLAAALSGLFAAEAISSGR